MHRNKFSKCANYNKKELDSYVNDENACVERINVTEPLALHPKYTSNIQEGARLTIGEKIGKYNKSVDGLILSFDNNKVLGKLSAIRSDSPYLHTRTNTDYYVFKPKIGFVIKGIVQYISVNYISVIIYKVFNVTIKLHNNIHNTKVQKGAEIKFKVVAFDLKSGIPSIEGVLIRDPKAEEHENDADSGISTEEHNHLSVDTKADCKKNALENAEDSSSESGSDSDHFVKPINVKVEPASDASSSADEMADVKKNALENTEDSSSESGSDSDHFVKPINVKVEPTSDASSSADEMADVRHKTVANAQRSPLKYKRKRESSSSTNNDDDEHRSEMEMYKKSPPKKKLKPSPIQTVKKRISFSDTESSTVKTMKKSSKKAAKTTTEDSDADFDLDAVIDQIKQESLTEDETPPPPAVVPVKNIKKEKTSSEKKKKIKEEDLDVESSIHEILANAASEISESETNKSDNRDSEEDLVAEYLTMAMAETSEQPTISKSKKKKKIKEKKSKNADEIDDLDDDTIEKILELLQEENEGEKEETKEKPKKEKKKKKNKSIVKSVDEDDSLDESMMAMLQEYAEQDAAVEASISNIKGIIAMPSSKIVDSGRKSVRFDDSVTNEFTGNSFLSSTKIEKSPKKKSKMKTKEV